MREDPHLEVFFWATMMSDTENVYKKPHIINEEKKRQTDLLAFCEKSSRMDMTENAETTERVSMEEEEFNVFMKEKMRNVLQENQIGEFKLDEIQKNEQLKSILYQRTNNEKVQIQILREATSGLLGEGFIFMKDNRRDIYQRVTTEILAAHISSFLGFYVSVLFPFRLSNLLSVRFGG